MSMLFADGDVPEVVAGDEHVIRYKVQLRTLEPVVVLVGTMIASVQLVRIDSSI